MYIVLTMTGQVGFMSILLLGQFALVADVIKSRLQKDSLLADVIKSRTGSGPGKWKIIP